MNEQNKVRVRFAPSPTGHLHIGSFRAALFNYLFARHNSGTYLLRIEDTDTERSKKEYVDSIDQSLKWAQLEADEKPLVQSSRIGEHQALIQKLVDEKKAYRCYCSQDEVVARYQASHDTTDTFIKYDGKCRNIVHNERDSFVIRFALPNVESLSFDDAVRGTVTVALDQLDDFIIARSDGTPTYNFVVVADDAYMRITHVIRGDDHISNTPKQIFLYQALGYALPTFAHIPLILGKEGNKLSKRDAATSVTEYIKQGYLPDAFLNYLARLGWSYGDQEIFSREELIRYFTLDAVGKKGAVFDPEKLDWVNSIYIKDASTDDLYTYMLQYVNADFGKQVKKWSQETIYGFIALYQERVKTVLELSNVLQSVHSGPSLFNQDDIDKWVSKEAVALLSALTKTLEQLDAFSVDIIKECIKNFCKEHGIKLVVVAQPIRIALVGSTSSPGIFDMLVLLGKEEVVHRLGRLLHYMQ